MKFSEYFNIGLDQSMLDFVDISLDADVPLYIDPYSISTRTDDWSRDCAASVNSFFQELVVALRAEDDDRAVYLLNNLHEPNETCLGLSKGVPSGRGVGGRQAQQLHAALSKSTAVRTGFVEDLADCELVVEGIGPDKISDITTNLIRSQLITYTQEQCVLHGIPMQEAVPSGPLWDAQAGRWLQRYVQLPVIENRRILLVPKFAVRWRVLLDHLEYYNRFVLDYIQANPEEYGGLAHLARARTGRLLRKALKEEFPIGKPFLLAFSEGHREVFEEYKATKASPRPLEMEEFGEDIDRRTLAHFLAVQLRNTPAGHAGQTRYHRLAAAILTFLFYPNLVTPRIEEPVNQERKRIDITYVNLAKTGLFRRFTPTFRKPSGKLVVECKNFTAEVGNEEVDQLAMRFADWRGWLGLLLCRSINDRARFNDRCRDVVHAYGGYVIGIDDQDLTRMLELSVHDGHDAVDDYLERLFDPLTR